MRKKIILSCLPVFLFIQAYTQQSIRNARKKSWQDLVYRISADTAEKYIAKTAIYPDHYLDQTPFAVWPADSSRFHELPAGNYLIISIMANQLVAQYYCQSDLQVFPLNNQHRVQLEIKDGKGNLIPNASVWVNKKEIKYNEAIKGFQLNEKRPDDAIIKIAVPGDTLFLELSSMGKLARNGWQQWWSNFRYTKVGGIISWPVRKIGMMIKTPASRWFGKKWRGTSRNGYMIFNKPKYLPGDTVKYKAYILNKGKQYRKGLEMFLEYYSNSGRVSKNMGIVKPATPGAFLDEFVLGDSLDSDRDYTIVFKKKKRVLMRGNFKIEDYLLDEVAVYNLRADKESYFPHDTVVVYASAKDANGLALMDGRVNLYLLSRNINNFYKEREFVPDTLWKGEKKLEVEGDTKFEIPLTGFPDADLSVKALAEFRNSNNEIQEKELALDFTSERKVVHVKQEGMYLLAEYMENGKPVSKQGSLYSIDKDKKQKIHFPWREKIDPYREEYFFRAEDDTGKVIAFNRFTPEGNSSLSFSRIMNRDTIGFSLYNPYKVPVHYTVFSGKEVLITASDTTEQISWKKVLSRKKIYNVTWSYIWQGREFEGSNTIAVLEQVLDAKISHAAMIYPGQTDTITVSVKDYKGNAAGNVNLTAVSYNSQFKNDIHVQEPPYIQKFKFRGRILFDEYELDNAGFTDRALLGNHQQWRKPFGLDTMSYYQLLFPKDKYAVASSVISDFEPQLSVHVVKKGVPQEIYMLYINREFAWYNGVTDKSAYAFMVVPGYTQVAIRLKDKYIQVDSIYLQPFYKYDISFDLDHLPANAKVEERKDYYEYYERQQIENNIWQLQYDHRTNYGYVWQKNKLVNISSNGRHLIGPFVPNDSLQLFIPGDFDFKFPFEPGYQYRLTPRMARLEKMNIFNASWKAKIKLLPVNSQWILGDTVVTPPIIKYEKKTVPSFLKATDNYWNSYKNNTGSLKIVLPADSSFIFGILYSVTLDSPVVKIRNYDINHFYTLSPGKYSLILVTSKYYYLVADNINITAGGTSCLQFNKPVYASSHPYIEELKRQYEDAKNEIVKYQSGNEINRPAMPSAGRILSAGNSSITGVVTDKNGKSPIPGATVWIKGTRTGTVTGRDGRFTFSNIPAGRYIVVFSSVGYASSEIRVEAKDYDVATADVPLFMSEAHLEEVVIVGYGTSKKSRELSYSMSKISAMEISSSLQGKMAGLEMRADSMVVRLRGTRSVSDKSKPVYVVNGELMDELPAGLDMNKVQVNILADEAAKSIYGARAANGVIIITTAEFIPKELREKFRDYAFWKPNLFTDADGQVKFTVTYPDNITGWETYVVGMDKKKRFVKTSVFTKSFKPLLAQLSTPQFLIEGDSSAFIGKVINYTTEGIKLNADFRVNDELSRSESKEVGANGAVTDALNVIAGNIDTLVSQYTVTTSSGYSDGELRRIPVFKRGIEEAIGDFRILDKDTSFTYTADKNASDITIHAQSNTLDVMLDEIKYLKDYPYFCMEQIASKITGLVMEKKIREALKQPFKGQADLQKLLSKLQKSQLFNGGWSWWEGGEANLYITNYVLQALLQLRGDPLLESNIRNAVLYLQNRLSLLKKDELISVLFTLSETGHEMDYRSCINKIVFDSLTLHQQWQVIKIRQQQKMGFAEEMKIVMSKKIGTMLGGLHWGEESYYWQNNNMATTALAFKVLEKEKEYEPLLNQMIQFFLERRHNGRWRNTVESANTLATILPTILKNNTNFNAAPKLFISGAITARVDSFPFTTKVPVSDQPVVVKKEGGGLVYFTAWQKIFNPQPEPVTDKFVISTWFEKTGSPLVSLTAGEKATMKIKIDVLKDAEYVQIEVPIPAGCTYAEKKQAGWSIHREFLKNKMVLFVEKMNKGVYTYEIELEPRYSGSYQLNPSKAELMYFPTFYGRNEMRKLRINK